MNQIIGIDYSLLGNGTTTTYSRREFQELMAKAIAAGGRRRCESDNVGPVTYIHGPDGRITHEAWANVPLRSHV